MTIPTRDEIAAALCLGALEPDARTLRQAGAVLSLLASKSETPETAKYPLKATKEMLDAAEISWNRSYEYEPYRFEKMLNAALAVVTIPLAESEQRGDRCAYVFTGREAYLVGYPDKLRYRSEHLCDEVRADHPLPGHAFMPAAEQCAYRYDPSMPGKGVCLWTRDEHPGRSEHAFVPPVSPKPEDRCGYVFPQDHPGDVGLRGRRCKTTRDLHDFKWTHSFVEPVSPMPPLGDAADGAITEAMLDAAEEGYESEMRVRCQKRTDGVVGHQIVERRPLLRAALEAAMRPGPEAPSAGQTRQASSGPDADGSRPKAVYDEQDTMPNSGRANLDSAGDAAGSEDADLKALIAEARKIEWEDAQVDGYAAKLIDRLADALEARESPLPSPAESGRWRDFAFEWMKRALTSEYGGFTPVSKVAEEMQAMEADAAGPAPSVEKEHCKTCGSFDHWLPNPRFAKEPDKNGYYQDIGCDDPFHSERPATVAPSPVDTMVSAADAFEKMRAARDAFTGNHVDADWGRYHRKHILTFMDAVIASHPACEDRKAK